MPDITSRARALGASTLTALVVLACGTPAEPAPPSPPSAPAPPEAAPASDPAEAAAAREAAAAEAAEAVEAARAAAETALPALGDPLAPTLVPGAERVERPEDSAAIAAIEALLGSNPLSLAPGEPRVAPEGAVPADRVRDVVRATTPALRACAAAARAGGEEPALTGGTLELRVTVSATGTVAGVERGALALEPRVPAGDPWLERLEACVGSLARSWSFPAPASAPAIVTVPLEIQHVFTDGLAGS